jgi:hypothetical protein
MVVDGMDGVYVGGIYIALKLAINLVMSSHWLVGPNDFTCFGHFWPSASVMYSHRSPSISCYELYIVK